MEKDQAAQRDEDIFHFMVFVYHKLSKPFEDYFKDEFTSAQIHALFVLSTSGPMTMSELAAALHCPPQQMSRMIEKLYEQGDIVRSFDASDRRKIHISVSQETAQYIKYGREKFVGSFNAVLKSFDERDYEEFKSSIRTVNRILNKIPQNM